MHLQRRRLMIRFNYASQLTSPQIDRIHKLVDACIEYELLTLGHPDLDADEIQVYQYFQTKKSIDPLAVLIAYPSDDYTEITAFTDPKHRCQGLFTALFQRYMSQNDEGPICFFPDGCSYDALSTLEVLDCEYTSTEHLMSCELKTRPLLPFASDFDLFACDDTDIEALSAIHSRAFDMPLDESKEFLQSSFDDDAVCWMIRKGDTPVGICLGAADTDTVYIYGFCIDPRFQKKGYGQDALALLLDCLSEVYTTVRIQVSEENTAAYHLYRKAGFVSNQELMEYWY